MLAAQSVHADTLPALPDTPAQHSEIADKQALNDVVATGNRLVAAGRRGIIVYSDDNGANWKQATVPVSIDLTALAFADAQHGIAVGHQGVILSTQDGGATWQRKLEGNALGEALKSYLAQLKTNNADAELISETDRLAQAGTEQSFLSVAYDTPKDIYAVGAFNLIFHSGDGGEHWQPLLAQTDNAKFLHLYSVRKIGDDLYIAGEQGLVLKLDRASGRFVAHVTPYTGSFFGVVGDRNAVLVFGLRGNAWRSTDGGIHWEQVEAGPPVGLTGATVLADGRWVLTDLAGAVLVSSDSGHSFKPAQVSAQPYFAVSAAANAIALAGLRGVSVQKF